MIITPDSNVAETEQLLEAMLDSGAICVTRSTTELGVHAQIIGEIRTKVENIPSFAFSGLSFRKGKKFGCTLKLYQLASTRPGSPISRVFLRGNQIREVDKIRPI